MNFPEFILASQSPQRKELLERAGYCFRVVAPTLHELQEAHAAPAQRAEALAYFKARAVQQQHPDALILGADTLVACAGQVLGKARDERQAREMLATLSHARHEVITGVAILVPGPAGAGLDSARRFLASEITYVTMRPWTEQETDRYLASGEWRDKAGAYAIQESADAYVEKIEGSFTNVVGLPMELLERMFEQVKRCLSGTCKSRR